MATFHPFPSLPAELRYAIWELTLEPREVVIKAHQQPQMSGENPNAIVHFSSPTPIPGALHACHDSRALLVPRHYTRAFTNGITPHYIWAAFALDTIRISDIDLPALVRLPDPLAIRYLTIDCPAHSRRGPAFATCMGPLRSLRTLKQASIVCVLNHQAARASNVNCSAKWVDFLQNYPIWFVFPGDDDRLTVPAWTMRFADTGELKPSEVSWWDTGICVLRAGVPPRDPNVRTNHAKLLRAARMP